ncbi:MAG: hypothetical protein RIR26_488 [Pseudomonadota bacterium]
MLLFSYSKSHRKSSIIFSLSLLGASSGCGKDEVKNQLKFEQAVEVSVKQNTPSSLSLDSDAVAAGFKIDVTGCESGFTGTNLNTSPIYLVKFDLNCLATLKEFSFGGVTYTGSLSGAAGTKAIFSGGTKQLSVSIESQLGSPLSDSDRISYKFNEITEGGSQNPTKITYSSGHSIAIAGSDSPNMEISSINISSLAAGGVPSWLIKFDCNSNVVNGNACPSAGGEAQKISDMDVKVIEDTTNGTLTLAQADSLFESAGGSAVFVPMGDLPHGGMSGTFTGPGPVYLKRNLLIVVRYRSNSSASYRYFNVDFAPIYP